MRTIRKRHRSFRYGRLSAPASLVETLEEVRALLAASVPDGDVAELVEQGLVLLKARALKKRFGASAAGGKGRRTKKRSSSDAKVASAPPEQSDDRPNATPTHSRASGGAGESPGTAAGTPKKRSRYIEAHVRSVPPRNAPLSRSDPTGPKTRPPTELFRAWCGHATAAPAPTSLLMARAAAPASASSCTHGGFAAGGRRLCRREHEPFARGGRHTASSLSLRCRAHNALAARQDFGSGFIQRRIEDASP